MLTAMDDTITCAAELTVALPREQVLALFTAEGERAWAGEDWDPAYPAAGRRRLRGGDRRLGGRDRRHLALDGVSSAAQRADGVLEPVPRHEDPVGVVRGDGEDRDLGASQRRAQRRHHAGQAEVQRPGDLEDPPAALDDRAVVGRRSVAGG